MNRNRISKILLVDDESSMIDVTQLILTELGYEVSTAGDGKEGLKVLESAPSDLVITDMVMPDMEGIEFIRALAKKRPSLPVIVMSGHGIGLKFLNSARAFGAKATLQKPFTPRQLSEAITAVANEL